MDNLPIQADVYTSFQGLNALKAEAGKKSPQALRAAAQQFEALFVQMVLKSMRSATLGGKDNLMENDQTRMYQDMFDKQMSLEITKGKGLGLADMLVRQLGGAMDKGTSSTSTAAGRAAPATTAPAAVAAPATPASRRQFVASLWPHAQAAARSLGVAPRVLVAQAALETGWGQGMPRRPDGRPSHNLFGIKAGSGWNGPQVTVPTLEFQGGVPVRRSAAFRAYDSASASFQDYAAVLRGNPRYREALQQAADPAAFAGALQQAGYATDPNYAQKISDILNSPVFQEALAGVKSGGGQPLT